ncbi:MAG: polyphosphate polymerase domain-containing protein [Thermoclostridium sp.]|nr:polyphosphate polymerase domain-containing protein [Thermoclostridium sp.]
MIATEKVYRHELKFYISTDQYLVLRRKLGQVMVPDPFSGPDNQYLIRSLYFDDIYNSALHDKISGVEKRKKYRLRLYNHRDSLVKLEKKGKSGQYTLKESERVTRFFCKKVIAGDCDFLKDSQSELQRGLYVQMKTALLRPVVLVDYIREAYVHPVGNVRVTFDMKLKTGLLSTEFFNPLFPMVEIMGRGMMIMEVKFDQFLPHSIQKLVSGVKGERDSISKYVLSRTFS